jgi:hypothetical protein
MRILGPGDPLPVEPVRRRARRGQIDARAHAQRSDGAAVVEFESFYHAPGWTVRPTWRDVMNGPFITNFVRKGPFITSGEPWAIKWRVARVIP